MTDQAPKAAAPRGLIGHSLIYSVAPLVRYGVSFGMNRFYTYALITALYGVKEMVDLWMILMQQLLGMNLLTSMVRFYYDRKDPEERARVVTSTTLVIALCAWAVCGVTFLFSGVLAPILIGQPTTEVSGEQIEVAFRFLVLLVPFQLSTLSGLYYLQTTKRSGLYTKIQTGKLVLEVLLHVLFMGVLDMGLNGFLLGLLLGEVVASVGLTGWMLWTLGPRIDWKVFKPILIYAAPLIPVGVFQLGLHQLDRRLLEHVYRGDVGLALAGVYGLGYKIGQLVNPICIWPFMQIWQPTIYGVEDETERARLVGRVTTWMVVAISAATLALIYGGRQAVDLIAGRPEYLVAKTVVPWIGAGYVFWALYSSAQMPLYLAKRTAPLLWINLLALAFCVGCNLVLIPRYQILGAAFSTMLTFALLSGLVMLVVRKVARVPFELGRLAGSLGTVLASCVLVRWLDGGDPYGSALELTGHLAAKAGLLALALFVLWRGVLHADERAEFQGAVLARLGRGRGGDA